MTTIKITATSTPREVDEALAALWHQIDAAQATIDSAESSAHHAIGERPRYITRTRKEWPTTGEQAMEILREGVAAVRAHYAAHGHYMNTPGPVSPAALTSAERALTRHAEARATLADLHAKVGKLEAIYRARPWSRFFLVTSSAGHVHASTACSTCRVTTTYGWLPELSGTTEGEAVAKLGAVLCSVCFPSAPVGFVGGRLTKAQAAKMAA
jgi:hypothetical protein